MPVLGAIHSIKSQQLRTGPPGKGRSVIFRLHHRSEAFGLVADEGGSNAMVIGLKQRF